MKEPHQRSESNASVRARLAHSQRTWAEGQNLVVDNKGYLASVDENLRVPLTSRVQRAFEDADGSELKPRRDGPPKMCALHSSSALAANFFDYWSERDTVVLLRALRLNATGAVRFEVKFPHGVKGKAPNLDIVFGQAPGAVAAIESKFGEWLWIKRPKAEPFKAKYFPERKDLWRSNGLPQCQALAEDIRASRTWFRWLDVPQLLKHALGLSMQLGDRFSLSYLYYDWRCPWQNEHREEISRFSNLVGSELRFSAMTYQEVFKRLKTMLGYEDAEYLNYLEARYFSNATSSPA